MLTHLGRSIRPRSVFEDAVKAALEYTPKRKGSEAEGSYNIKEAESRRCKFRPSLPADTMYGTMASLVAKVRDGKQGNYAPVG